MLLMYKYLSFNIINIIKLSDLVREHLISFIHLNKQVSSRKKNKVLNNSISKGKYTSLTLRKIKTLFLNAESIFTNSPIS